MTNERETTKKIVLLVEDDLGMIQSLEKRLLLYEDITLRKASSAADALQSIDSAPDGECLAAAVFDLMLPYGNVQGKLATDADEIETGIRLLEYLRDKENKDGTRTHLWVAVITARSGIAVGSQVRRLLAERGKLYLKPFNTLHFEHDLVTAIGVASQVPPELRSTRSV